MPETTLIQPHPACPAEEEEDCLAEVTGSGWYTPWAWGGAGRVQGPASSGRRAAGPVESSAESADQVLVQVPEPGGLVLVEGAEDLGDVLGLGFQAWVSTVSSRSRSAQLMSRPSRSGRT